jgi:NAD(P)H-dependent FMN reductase
MAGSPKVLAFAGSAREGSYNKQLVQVAAKAAEAAGAEVTYVDLRDYPMPLFNEDDEKANGLPETAKRFRELMKQSDAFLISSPEYNGSISGLLKNVIDWASRPVEGEAPLECFTGKTCALLSASPGRLGGIRALPEVQRILSGIGVNVLAKNYCLSAAHEAFTDDGDLKDEKTKETVEAVAKNLVERCRKVSS